MRDIGRVAILLYLALILVVGLWPRRGRPPWWWRRGRRW